MRILPVIDLKGGVVVRGIAGRREGYRPINSVLLDSCQPLDVANAFRERFGFNELYLADLDAISGSEPAWDTFAELQAAGFRLWLDAGIQDRRRAMELKTRGIHRIIAGMETVAGLDALHEIHDTVGPSTLVFSVDLRNGEPLGERGAWSCSSPLAIVTAAAAFAMSQFIVLDIGRVGRSEGVGTLELCRAIREQCPDLLLISGGGVRDLTDLRTLHDAGVNAALVASALHDGRLSRNHLDTLCSWQTHHTPA